MKKSDIVLGGMYSNGKGRTRKVIGMGPLFKLYPSQESINCLRYESVGGPKREDRGNMTIESFATWAKERIE